MKSITYFFTKYVYFFKFPLAGRDRSARPGDKIHGRKLCTLTVIRNVIKPEAAEKRGRVCRPDGDRVCVCVCVCVHKVPLVKLQHTKLYYNNNNMHIYVDRGETQ